MSSTSGTKDLSYILNVIEGTRKEVDRVVAERNFVVLVNEVVQILAEENSSLRTENDMLRERLNLAAISDYRISDKHRRVLLSQGLVEEQLRVPVLIDIVAQYTRRVVEGKSKTVKKAPTPSPDQAPPAPSVIPIAPQQRQFLASFIERYSNPTNETTTSTSSILNTAEVRQAEMRSSPSKPIFPIENRREAIENRREAIFPIENKREAIFPIENKREAIFPIENKREVILPIEKKNDSRNKRSTNIDRAVDVNRDLLHRDPPLEPLPEADIRPFKSTPAVDNRLPRTALEHTSNGHENTLTRPMNRRRPAPQPLSSSTWGRPQSKKIQWESDPDEINDPIDRMRLNPRRKRRGALDNGPNDLVKCEYPPCQRVGHRTEDCKIRKRYESTTG